MLKPKISHQPKFIENLLSHKSRRFTNLDAIESPLTNSFFIAQIEPSIIFRPSNHNRQINPRFHCKSCLLLIPRLTFHFRNHFLYSKNFPAFFSQICSSPPPPFSNPTPVSIRPFLHLRFDYGLLPFRSLFSFFTLFGSSSL